VDATRPAVKASLRLASQTVQARGAADGSRARGGAAPRAENARRDVAVPWHLPVPRMLQA
jgi:hypothetical protein